MGSLGRAGPGLSEGRGGLLWLMGPRLTGPPALLGASSTPHCSTSCRSAQFTSNGLKAVLFLPKSSRSADVPVSSHVLSHQSPKMTAL